MSKVYISIDGETDGGCPGQNNLLTFGAAAFSSLGELLQQFYVRIVPLPWLHPNPETMIWWRQQDPSAYYEAFGENLKGVLSEQISDKPRVTAFDAMIEFAIWLDRLKAETKYSKLISVAWPAAFDHPFIKYYCDKFLGKHPLGYDCLDIRSYIQGILRKPDYYDFTEEEIYSIFGRPDSAGLRKHVAIDDAILQGRLYFLIRNSNIALPS